MPLLSEVEEKIIEEPILINYYPDGGSVKYNSIQSVKKYINEEIAVWAKIRFENLSIFYDSYTQLLRLCNRIESSEDLEHQVKDIIKLKSVFSDKNILSSKSNFMVYCLAHYDNDESIFMGIYNYYFDIKKSMTDPRYLKGQLLAFYYKENEKTKLFRKGFFTDQYKNDQNKYKELIGKISSDYYEKKQVIDTDLDAHLGESKKWFEEKKVEYEEFIKSKNQILTGMENTYKEKLRLEGPASYWESFRDKYQSSGMFWMLLCVITGIGIAFTCLYLLKNMPEQLFTGDKLSIENTIRWTIILTLILSTGFYLFRLFMKLCLSSFHLSRDANERFQLTHQFLSLLNENAIDEKNREIILQSLFSRADTGLLKGDSSPTMPDGIVSQILKNIR